MKHAGDAALDELEDLLAIVRERSELIEKKRGTFYRKSSAFLHFHEDREGLFADLKVDGQWQRMRVSTAAERKQLLRRLAATATCAYGRAIFIRSAMRSTTSASMLSECILPSMK